MIDCAQHASCITNFTYDPKTRPRHATYDSSPLRVLMDQATRFRPSFLYDSQKGLICNTLQKAVRRRLGAGEIADYDFRQEVCERTLTSVSKYLSSQKGKHAATTRRDWPEFLRWLNLLFRRHVGWNLTQSRANVRPLPMLSLTGDNVVDHSISETTYAKVDELVEHEVNSSFPAKKRQIWADQLKGLTADVSAQRNSLTTGTVRAYRCRVGSHIQQMLHEVAESVVFPPRSR